MKPKRTQHSSGEDTISETIDKIRSNSISVVILSITGILGLSFGFFIKIYLLIIISSMLIISTLWINTDPRKRIELPYVHTHEEKSIIDALKGLNDSYLQISNVKLKDLTSKLNDPQLKNLSGNIDHVILGLNGLFVIKTLNHKGKITCDEDDWYRSFSHRDFPIRDSPSRQVKRNSAVLRIYLANNLSFIKNINKNIIYGLIVVTKPNADLVIKDSTVAILKPDELVNYLKNLNTENYFSKEELKIIAKAILNSKNQ